MENNKKPIENIKEDIASVAKAINKLQEDFQELRKLNNEIKDKIQEYIDYNEKPILIDKPKKSKSWFYD